MNTCVHLFLNYLIYDSVTTEKTNPHETTVMTWLEQNNYWKDSH